MAKLMHEIVVIVFFCLGATSGQAALTCDDGWTRNGMYCYQFVTDVPLDLNSALEGCFMKDARLAFAEDQAEMSYLSSAVQQKNLYAWWLGIKYYYSSYSDTTKVYVAGMDGKWKWVNNTFVLPQVQNKTDNLKCVAYHPDYRLGYMSREVCTALLPYVCTGTQQRVVNPDYASPQWNLTNGIAYYFSSTKDQLSFSDAQKSCNDKGLNLMVINEKTSNLIRRTLYYDKNDAWMNGAWWTGLIPGPNGYTWTDGSTVNKSLVSFTTPRIGSTKYFMLMGTGSARYATKTYRNNRPYICKKRGIPSANFGCPSAWLRGGQSCYFASLQQRLNWADANKKCKTMGGHLISVNSQDEKLWVESNAKLSSSSSGYWTSLNDIKTEGTYVWDDGAKFDPGLIRWTMPLTSYGQPQSQQTLAAQGRLCAYISPSRKRLIGTRCSSRFRPGCQYLLQSGKQCAQDWMTFKGYCYFTGKSSRASSRPWASNLALCNSLLADVDPTITVDYINIHSKELLNFLSDNSRLSFWTGLNTVKSPSILRWSDGTMPDYSIFPNGPEPDNGSGGKEEDCITVTGGGFYKDEDCTSEKKFICEREINYAAPSRGGNSAAPSIHSVSSTLLGVCVMMLVKCIVIALK